ncbi:MAG: PH domain-containing protein [Acidimicrobiales bacterium]
MAKIEIGGHRIGGASAIYTAGVAFPQDYLHPNEELILDLKPHWFRLVPSAGSLAAALLVGIIVLVNIDNQVVSILVGVLILAVLAWFGATYATWNATHFVVTSDRLIHREGVVSRSGVEIPLDRINTVFTAQSVFERVIGAGDLTIESAGAEGRQEFHDIRKPTKVQNEIYVAKEDLENRRYDRIAQSAAGHAEPQTAAPNPEASIPDQIDQLDALRKRGVISEEEFTRKKTELLGRM